MFVSTTSGRFHGVRRCISANSEMKHKLGTHRRSVFHRPIYRLAAIKAGNLRGIRTGPRPAGQGFRRCTSLPPGSAVLPLPLADRLFPIRRMRVLGYILAATTSRFARVRRVYPHFTRLR